MFDDQPCLDSDHIVLLPLEKILRSCFQRQLRILFLSIDCSRSQALLTQIQRYYRPIYYMKNEAPLTETNYHAKQTVTNWYKMTKLLFCLFGLPWE